MMRIILLISLIFIFQNCENPKSNEDKLKSNYKDKPLNFLRDYLYVRTIFGGRYFMGDPLCGGDPIGTALGLNNDIPKPINLEVGKTYEYEGNVNQTQAGRNYNGNNLFRTASASNKSIEIKIILTSDCLGQEDGFYFNLGVCVPNALQYITSSSNCLPGYSIENIEKKHRKFKNDFQVCTVASSVTGFFILLTENQCKYKIEIKGV